MSVLLGQPHGLEGLGRIGVVPLLDDLAASDSPDDAEPLLDGNAASHIALGAGYDHPVDGPEDKARVNQSVVHVDFMIGSLAHEVDGITVDGKTVPVLRNGAWQI